MNILGVGGWEVAVILVIMLIVAGPKRMIAWAYVLGQYTSKLRRMWAETMTAFQKELNESGVDIELPKDIPTRGTLNQEVGKMLTPLTKPFQEAMQEGDLSDSLPKNLIGTTKIGNGTPSGAAKPPAAGAATNSPPAAKPAPPKTQTPPKPATNGQTGGSFGTWSGDAPKLSSNDKPANLGTWSGNGSDKP
jgi:Sec-independent protein translocase protein TatA